MMLIEMEKLTTLPAGFTARPAEMADLKTAVSLFNACSLVRTGKEEFSPEDVLSEWKTEDFDLDKSTRVVLSPDEELVGYIEVWDLHAVPVSPWVWGRVHPEFEGLGIGTYLLEWAEKRVEQVFPRLPEDARVVMRSGHISTYEPAMALLTDYGMEPTRSFWTMVIDLEEEPETAVLPANIRISTFAEEDDLRAVVQATEQAFQDHWGFVPQPLEDELRQWEQWVENDPHFDPSLWLLAMDDRKIAGISLCRMQSYEDPDMGWVNTLGVLRPWRRQGLGLALLRHSFKELYQRGKRAVGLGVDADSLTGATGLYKKAGMHVHRQFINYEKELRPGRDLMKRTL